MAAHHAVFCSEIHDDDRRSAVSAWQERTGLRAVRVNTALVRGVVLGIVMLGTWTGAVLLTVRRVDGLRRLNATVSEPGFPTSYMLGALAVSAAAALVINPASDRSFDLGDWLRTAAVVVGVLWFGRRINRKVQSQNSPLNA